MTDENDGSDLANGVDELFRGKIVVKWALVVDLLDPNDESRQLATASSPSCASWDAYALLETAVERELFTPDYEFDEPDGDDR